MFYQREIFFRILFHLFLFQLSASLNSPVVEPGISKLTSNSSERIFFCNGGKAIGRERLNISVERSIPAPPAFQLKTEQVNATTVRVSIFPNGYVGLNRIFCFWEHRPDLLDVHDLIVGDSPGVIRIKERCRAYDRQYVQCIFSIPTLGRAYRNGFRPDYTFIPLNRHHFGSYVAVQNETVINEQNEMIVKFKVNDRNQLFRETAMMLTMSLGSFGSTGFNFSLEPVHTTRVNYSIESRSKGQLTLHINHTNHDVSDQRLCAGDVSEIDSNNRSTLIRTISPTSDLKIHLNHLQPSKHYSICLRCYYDEKDLSFKEEVCQSSETQPSGLFNYIYAAILVALVLMMLIGLGGLGWLKRRSFGRRLPWRRQKQEIKVISDPWSSDSTPEPIESDSLCGDSAREEPSDPKLDGSSIDENGDKYRPMYSSDAFYRDCRAVAQDTINLT